VFNIGVSVLAAVLFGVLPALASSSARTMGALRDGGHGSTLGRERHRARNVLVITQVALAFVLVMGSGLMVRTFEALRSVDPGFSADDVLTFTVQPLATKYENPEALVRFYDGLIERLEAVPGVTEAGAINTLPLTGGNCCKMTTLVEEFPPPEGELQPAFAVRRATPGYFEAMGIPLIEGRAFTPDDHNRRLDSVIISRSVKDRYWPDTSALGKRVNPWGVRAQVVGVVGDVHDTGLDVPADQFAYLPMLDAGTFDSGFIETMTITVRTEVEPLSLVDAIRTATVALDPDLPMTNVRSMQQVLGDSMSRASFTASVLLIAALVALFLGSVGIYGVLSYVVTQRTPEIGIRSALGATPEVVRRMILSQGMWLAGAGVLIGLVAAVALGQVLATQLYGVSPVDPATIAIAAAIFVGVAMVASFVPAARAAGTSPLDALRAG
jgi:putative ABC transport system permease protein